ncbi:hypothetical protein Tco_0396888 [Tanacetum coccineum]
MVIVSLLSPNADLPNDSSKSNQNPNPYQIRELSTASAKSNSDDLIAKPNDNIGNDLSSNLLCYKYFLDDYELIEVLNRKIYEFVVDTIRHSLKGREWEFRRTINNGSGYWKQDVLKSSVMWVMAEAEPMGWLTHGHYALPRITGALILVVDFSHPLPEVLFRSYVEWIWIVKENTKKKRNERKEEVEENR